MSKSIHIRIRAAFKTNFLGFGSDHPPPTPTPYGPPHHKISVFWRLHMYKKNNSNKCREAVFTDIEMAVTFCATWRAHTVVYTCCQPYSHTGIYNPFKIIEPLANGVCKFASSELSPWWRWQLGSNRLQVAQHCTFALVLNQFRSIISSLWPNNNTILPKKRFSCYSVTKSSRCYSVM